ncbi:MAG TPA: hypothetical protein VJ717_20380 [Gemmatimonadaceae bacterium]|nr:hypothetical protein [Gemmatimonadaceae bacterium]
MTESRRTRKARAPDALELTATWISGVLLVAIVGFLVWDARQPSRPPSFETVIESQEQRGSYVYVTVAVRNLGDAAARAVEVRVRPEGRDIGSEAHFTLDWVPGRSMRRGIAVLPQNIALGRLQAEVVGYAEP